MFQIKMDKRRTIIRAISKNWFITGLEISSYKWYFDNKWYFRQMEIIQDFQLDDIVELIIFIYENCIVANKCSFF